MKNTLVYLVFFLMYSVAGIAQKPDNIKFDRITSENIVIQKGLSQNLVNCIIQDNDGYMWFGTWDGLNRYDGYEFKIFGKKEGLSNSTINCILQDADERLWIGTEDGLNILDLSNFSIEVHRKESGNNNSPTDNTINDICLDRDGCFWICTSNGLNKYKPANKSYSRMFFTHKEADSINSNWINCIIQDKAGDMWLGTRNGLFCYKSSEKIFIPFFHDPNNEMSVSDNNVQDIIQGSDGKLWIGTSNGLNCMDIKSNHVERYYDANNEYSLSNNFINCLYQDRNGLLWIGTNNKLNLFIPEDDKFYNFGHTSKSNSLTNNIVYSIYEDRLDNLWVGTYKGLNKIDKYSSKFIKYEKNHEKPNSLSSNIIFSISRDIQGNILLGTSKGLNIFDRENNKYDMLDYRIKPNTHLRDVRIRSLRKDSKDNLWIGTEGHGIIKYDQKNRRFEHFKYSPEKENTVAGNTAYYIIEDSNHNIWIATSNGLSKYNPANHKFTNYRNDPGNPNSLSNNNLWHVYEDDEGMLWISTDLGVNRFNPETGNWKRYVHDHSDEISISSNQVFSTYQDSDGELWMGTMGGGLNKYNPETESFHSFNEDDGLPNNVIYNIVEDDNGDFWLNTNWGLSRFTKSDSSFVNYDIKDGLMGNEFNGGAFYKAEDGELFFGGMNGFNAFHPDEIKYNTRVPEIAITRFKIFNKVQPVKISNGDTLTLNFRDNFFSFEFSALDYSNPSKNKYLYKLENYDKDWIPRDADRRIAEYANIKPGEYTFRVKASNNDGVWNEEGFNFTLIIPPPWYRQWWFRISFMVFVLALIWFLIYRRIRNIKKKNEIEKRILNFQKQLFEIEQKALRLQMNPHFIFNSLNAIQSFVVANDTDKAIHYLSKFSQLMRLILTNSRETIIPIKDEVKALTYFMDIEKLRFDNKFDYSINVDPHIDGEFVAIPPMVIQPYVENAILHGLIHNNKKGHLEIDLKLQKDTIFCIIEDNGIGREKARKLKEEAGIKRESKGMIITRERLDLLNNRNKDKYSIKIIDLKNKKGKATGTRVEIMMMYEEI